MEELGSRGTVLPSLHGMPLTSLDPLRSRLEAGRVATRRAVLRRRRSLSALLAGLAVLAGLAAVAPPPPPTVPVVVAARDLPSGAVLTAGDLDRVELPAGRVPSGLVTEVAGRTLAAPVRQGEPVTDVRLVGPGLAAAHPDRAVVPVRLPDAGAVALLRVGDRVDVVASDPARPDAPAEVVTAAATVLALPAEAAAASSYQAPGAVSGALVVLAVEEGDATRVHGSAATGVLGLTIAR